MNINCCADTALFKIKVDGTVPVVFKYNFLCGLFLFRLAPIRKDTTL